MGSSETRLLYPSDLSIKTSIDYFRNRSFDSPEQLGLFFFFKSLGLSDNKFTPFPKISSISEESRKDYLAKLYNLSGLYDYTIESGDGKCCCLFPFSISLEISKKDLYNPGTAFKGLLSRLRDTVDNTLIDESKFLRKDDTNSDLFKFPRNYIELLLNNFMKSNRLSIVFFASWYFRFRGIECPLEWISQKSDKERRLFTRVCVKTLIHELKINDDELGSLFYEDENELIDFSSSKINSNLFRSYLNFDGSYKPEIYNLSKGGNDYMDNVENVKLENTLELALPTGDNISPDDLYELLLKTKQAILYGVPGTSKSHIVNEIKVKFSKTEFIQFHSNSSYEQFIGGITVDSSGSFVSQAGIFTTFCENAKDNPNDKFLFVIDEINRADVSKVFGELIVTLDREYSVVLSKPILVNGKQLTSFKIPSNVYLIATMNSADRSIAQIDYAIRRRFAFVKFYTNYELISSLSDTGKLSNIKPDVLLKSLNKKILSVLKDEDLLLGHSYFIPSWALNSSGKIEWTDDVLKELFNYYIIPILEEYTYGNAHQLNNILGSNLPHRLSDTKSFINEIKLLFKVN